MPNRIDELQGSINDRQRELHSVTAILANVAARRARWATASKVIVIALGAFAATKSAADQLLGAASHISMVTYTLAGLVIATVAGLEAAFKNETTAAELRILAAAGQSTVRQVDTRWQHDIGGVAGQERVDGASRKAGVVPFEHKFNEEFTVVSGQSSAVSIQPTETTRLIG